MIFITGATTPTGSRVAKRLLEMEEKVVCLVRTKDNERFLPEKAETLYGEISALEQKKEMLKNCTVFINIAHIKYAETVIELCEESGIKRAIFLSSTRRYSKIDDPSISEVIKGEKLIKESSLDYTIIRPSMIFGSERDNNVSRIAAYLKKRNVFPVFGSGSNLVQPVFVDDVADAVVSAVKNETAIKKAYTICGAKAMTYKEMVKIIAGEMGVKVKFIPLPTGIFAGAARLAESFDVKLPLTSKQIQRFSESRSYDYSPAVRELNFHPTDFRKAIQLTLSR